MVATLFSIDSHAAGEPCRVVYGGIPQLRGADLHERRRHFRDEFDWIRTGLTREPRGHDGMFGALLLPAVRPTSAYGLVYFDTRGYLDGCGHATLCSIVVWRRMMGLPPLPFEIDNPDGSVTRVLAVGGTGEYATATVEMPPARVIADGLELSGLNRGCVAVAHCGNAFVVVGAEAVGVSDLHRAGIDVIRAASRTVLDHVPPDLSPNGQSLEVLIYQRLSGEQPTYATTAFFNAHQVDRSPCGTGSSALTALLLSRGEVRPGDRVRTIGPSGEPFELVGAHRAGGQERSFTVQLAGAAHITGVHQWIFSEVDTLSAGYQFE